MTRPHLATVVLVVDDAPETLGFLCDALAHEGYTVLVARDGREAQARLELAMPDAVLLDAVMPGPSGFDVCRWIKQDPTRAHVPVLFMTGLGETHHVVEGFAAGGVDYVVKPVRVAEVLARLATHVRNARVARLAREATDIAGKGVVLLDGQGRIAWQSPVAQAALSGWHDDERGARLQAACDAGENRLQMGDGGRCTCACSAPPDSTRRWCWWRGWPPAPQRPSPATARRCSCAWPTRPLHRARPRCCPGSPRARPTATSPTSSA